MKRKLATPRLSVVGLYSPAANHVEYERYVANRIAAQDPATFTQETVDLLSRLRREVPPALSESERKHIREEVDFTLGKAALVEVLAENIGTDFDIGDFVQSDPKVREDWSQCAWQETYLSEDGTFLLSGYPSPVVPSLPRFRVAFYIHSWRRRLGLLSTYGWLELPRQKPMPKRLWRLMPYESVD